MTATFAEVERDGWNVRADVYGDTTARATTQAIPLLLSAVRPRFGDRLVDICTGPGFAAGAAAAIGCEVTGVDFAADMVEQAKASFPRCSFTVGDAENLDLNDRAFDCAVCNFGVFHFAEPEKAFREALRVLKPGGRYAWSQWQGPDRSPFFATVFKAVAGNANMDVGLPEAPLPFRFSDDEVARTEMSAAGFEGIEVAVVPIVLAAPADTFFDFFRKFSVRVTMILERQEPGVLRTIEDEIMAGLQEFAVDGMLQLPMPAIIVSGRKPQ